MILSFNFYYAHPGLAEAVLRQRLHACEVRTGLGLPRGSVLVRTHGHDALPDVIWELEFDAIEGHMRDMDARAASPEFEAVRAGMRKLCRRFERPLFEVVSAALRAPPPVKEVDRAVVLDWIYCAPETTASIWAALAAQVARCEETVVASTLAQLISEGNDLPQLVWKREYSRDPALEASAVAAQPAGAASWPDLSTSAPYRRVRSVWTVRSRLFSSNGSRTAPMIPSRWNP